MSNPNEEPDLPEVLAEPEDEGNPDDLAGEYVDDPLQPGDATR